MGIDPDDKLFCQIAIKLDYITKEQAISALKAQQIDEAIGQKKRIGAYLFEMNLLTREQVGEILKRQKIIIAKSGPPPIPQETLSKEEDRETPSNESVSASHTDEPAVHAESEEEKQTITDASKKGLKKSKLKVVSIGAIISVFVVLLFNMIMANSSEDPTTSQKSKESVIALNKQLAENMDRIAKFKKEKEAIENNQKKGTSNIESYTEEENKLLAILIDHNATDDSTYAALVTTSSWQPYKTKFSDEVFSVFNAYDGEIRDILRDYLDEKKKNNRKEKDDDRLKSCVKQITDLIDQYRPNKLTNHDREKLHQICLEASINHDVITDLLAKRDRIYDQTLEIGTVDRDIFNINENIKSTQEIITNLEHAIAIKTKRISPKTIDDYALLYNASKDDGYTYKPPLDGPSETAYYVWSGKLTDKDGGLYIVWEVKTSAIANMWNESHGALSVNPIHTRGFAFKDIKKKLKELNQGGYVTVVGKYSSNTEISLVNGEAKTIPILTDCFVE